MAALRKLDEQSARALYNDRLDAGLDPEGDASLAAYLREHPDEAEELAEVARVLELMQGAAVPEPPSDFYLRLRRRMRRQAAARASFFDLTDGRLFGGRVPFELFAAVVLVMLAAISAVVAPHGLQPVPLNAGAPDAMVPDPNTARLDFFLPEPTGGAAIVERHVTELGGQRRIVRARRGMARSTRMQVALPLSQLPELIRRYQASEEVVLLTHDQDAPGLPTDLTLEVRLVEDLAP